MYRILTIICLCNFAIAAEFEDKDANALEYHYNNDGKGNYDFSYLTSNGLYREETGRLVNVGEKNEHMVVKGLYTFRDDNGPVKITFKYTADETGYHVEYHRLVRPVTKSGALVASLLGK